MKELDRMALFRLSVLGPLVSRPSLERGELQTVLRDLAQQEYAIPGSDRRHVAEKTLQGWYYEYLRDGLDGLTPKRRSDHGRSKLTLAVQEALLAAKRENPHRSLQTLQQWLEQSGQAAHGSVSRSAIHRLLQQHGLSRPLAGASVPEERRSFVAAHANDIWYGDVLHGPRVRVRGRGRKAYLVSLFDDASRLIPHSAFCLGETALDIEGVLKQGVLKRGVCRKLIVDNGAAYRATTLQNICARLGAHLIYCRPYAPEGKGKLERWHRTFRAQFLSEIALGAPLEIDDLNARLWAWIEQLCGLHSSVPLNHDPPELKLSAISRPQNLLQDQGVIYGCGSGLWRTRACLKQYFSERPRFNATRKPLCAWSESGIYSTFKRRVHLEVA